MRFFLRQNDKFAKKVGQNLKCLVKQNSNYPKIRELLKAKQLVKIREIRVKS